MIEREVRQGESESGGEKEGWDLENSMMMMEKGIEGGTLGIWPKLTRRNERLGERKQELAREQ